MFRALYKRFFKTKKCISKRNALARRDVYPEDIKGKERNILLHLQLDNLRFKNVGRVDEEDDGDTLEKILEDAKDLQRRTR